MPNDNKCIFFFPSSDRGETDAINFVTAYDIGKARNELGEKEMSAHFEEKRGFTNMGFDGKASQTKQIDNTLVVKSNVTCISDGTFLEYFQPKDGTDQTYGLELHKVVKKYEAEESCEFIEADSTAVNTGLSLFFLLGIIIVIIIDNITLLLFFQVLILEQLPLWKNGWE